ncbi:MAG: tripartite tricarboxylate transporter substrate binding protein, partial [Pseudolabrys sp.]
MTRIRSGIFCVLAVLAAALSVGDARAQTDYPSRPIHFIVGFAAGGGNDLFARLVVQKFQENTGATAVIDNR